MKYYLQALKALKICIFIREREKKRESECTQGGRGARGKGDSQTDSPWSMEPNTGLDPGP